jgi:stage V sporulation protein K
MSLPARTPDEVLRFFEQGQLTPAEAFALLRKLELKQPPLSIVRRVAEPRGGKIADEQVERQRNIATLLTELDALIGLDEVKLLVREVQAFLTIQQRRRQEMLLTEPLVLHAIFKGNPGTGKTTVARLFGRLFLEMGVLPKGHLIECERADLVGEYIGHTAQKTRELVRKALGGILFIDEAYALARGGEKDFGKEAIDTLVKAMEDHKEQLILILAGYRREMDYFLLTNPGLTSRFPIQIDFPDFSVNDLMRIATLMLRQRQYRLTPGARRKLAAILHEQLEDGNPHFGNARFVRNMLERAIRRQALRLVGQASTSTREQLMLITESDLEVPA